MRPGLEQRVLAPLTGLVVVAEKAGEVETTPGDDDTNAHDENCLGAGTFQVIRPIFDDRAHFAVKLSHLPPLGPVKADHGQVVADIGRSGSQPINHARTEQAGQQHDDAGQPQPAAAPGGAVRSR